MILLCFFLRFPYDLVTIDFMKFYDFLVGVFFGYDLLMVSLCSLRSAISHIQSLLGCKTW